MLQQMILIVHVVAALVIIGLVLLQHGKGADMGAAFGSGSAGSLFGASGAANFLSRSTAVCAAIFFATSLGLTYFSAPSSKSGVLQRVDPLKIEQKLPAAQAPAEAATPQAGDSKSQEIPK
jgi:preprotein translocase subunit SecG